MNIKSISVLALLVLGAGTSAHGATFLLTFSSAADQSALDGDGEPGFSGSATLTGTELSPGHYNITAATNTTIVDPNFGSQTYAYIANPSPNSFAYSPDGFLTYDGALFSGTPHLSEDGLLWIGSGNGADESVFSFKGAYYILDVYNQANPADAFFSASVIDLSISAVPEPPTWAFMLLGFAGVSALACWRRKAFFVV